MRNVMIEVKRVLVEQLDVLAEDVQPESRLVEDLGADSLALVEMLFCFEEDFEIDIKDDDSVLEKIVTVQDVVNYLENRLAPQENI